MQDRELHITVTCLVAYLFWLLSLGVWLAAWEFHSLHLSNLGLILAAAAVTAQVRGYFIRQAERIRTALIVTGRAAPVNVRSLN